MKKATDRMDEELRAWGYWNRHVTDAGDSGKSSLDKILQMMRTGIMSHGTGYLDRSSDTMIEPERYAGLQECINELSEADRAIAIAAYRLDVSDLPEAMHERVRMKFVSEHIDTQGKSFGGLKRNLISRIVLIDSRLHGESLEAENRHISGSM